MAVYVKAFEFLQKWLYLCQEQALSPIISKKHGGALNGNDTVSYFLKTKKIKPP